MRSVLAAFLFMLPIGSAASADITTIKDAETFRYARYDDPINGSAHYIIWFGKTSSGGEATLTIRSENEFRDLSTAHVTFSYGDSYICSESGGLDTKWRLIGHDGKPVGEVERTRWTLSRNNEFLIFDDFESYLRILQDMSSRKIDVKKEKADFYSARGRFADVEPFLKHITTYRELYIQVVDSCGDGESATFSNESAAEMRSILGFN